MVVPGSHLVSAFPSDDYIRRNEIATTAAAGSVLVMDSMVFSSHRPQPDTANSPRRQSSSYTIPIIKQQISLPRLPRREMVRKIACAPGSSVIANPEPAASVDSYLEKRRRTRKLKLRKTGRPISSVRSAITTAARSASTARRRAESTGIPRKANACALTSCSASPAGSRHSLSTEIGCGYGALVDHLEARGVDAAYHGIDLSADMIEAARRMHSGKKEVSFSVGNTPDRPRTSVSHPVSSMSVPPYRTETGWINTILSTLDMMHENARNGFSFNALTSYSDPEKMRDYLYYANPPELFDHCKRRYARHVALLHDYGLYEFTLLVRKTL